MSASAVTPRGADVAPGVPTPRLVGAARTLTVKTVLSRLHAIGYARNPIGFQLICIAKKYFFQKKF